MYCLMEYRVVFGFWQGTVAHERRAKKLLSDTRPSHFKEGSIRFHHIFAFYHHGHPVCFVRENSHFVAIERIIRRKLKICGSSFTLVGLTCLPPFKFL